LTLSWLSTSKHIPHQWVINRESRGKNRALEQWCFAGSTTAACRADLPRQSATTTEMK
jgi:hypothetical protein